MCRLFIVLFVFYFLPCPELLFLQPIILYYTIYFFRRSDLNTWSPELKAVTETNTIRPPRNTPSNVCHTSIQNNGINSHGQGTNVIFGASIHVCTTSNRYLHRCVGAMLYIRVEAVINFVRSDHRIISWTDEMHSGIMLSSRVEPRCQPVIELATSWRFVSSIDIRCITQVRVTPCRLGDSGMRLYGNTEGWRPPSGLQ